MVNDGDVYFEVVIRYVLSVSRTQHMTIIHGNSKDMRDNETSASPMYRPLLQK